MKKRGPLKIKTKRIIVFSFEGKNNKTESNYFSHFKAHNDSRYIIKMFSSGVTDVQKMINETKRKRKEYGYDARDDLTYIFVDDDSDSNKKQLIKKIQSTLPKDINLIVSSPCFEIWFINHFVKTTKFYFDKELIVELKKYIVDYSKERDYYNQLKDKTVTAISNSNYQINNANSNCKTDVVSLFNNNVIKEKDN